MDTSKFNLWRACFSFCFIDGFLSPEEHKWIASKLKDLKFTEEEREILMADLVAPPAISALLPLITKPADRGFLVNHIRMLSLIDKDLSKEEKLKIEEIRQGVLGKIDLKNLESLVAQDEKASYHEDEVYKVHNKHSYLEKVVMDLLKVLNPGDYKLPK